MGQSEDIPVKFFIRTRNHGQRDWILSEGGGILLTSSEDFITVDDAKENIEKMKALLPKIEVAEILEVPFTDVEETTATTDDQPF